MNEVVVSPTLEFWGGVVSMLDNANAEFEVVETDERLQLPTHIEIGSLDVEMVLDPEVLSEWLDDLRWETDVRAEAEVYWNE